MKTTFKDLYLPIKNNLQGVILNHEKKHNNELIEAIMVTLLPVEKCGKRCVSVNFFYNGRSRWSMYGKTVKEIRELSKDIKLFNFDPYLFLSL